MGALAPKFTESFVVAKEEKDPERYGTFIDRVREGVIESCTPATADKPPVLPLEGSNPTLWFHIILFLHKTNDGEPDLTLAVRMDNLYLVGFKTRAKTRAGEWWEFGKEKEDTPLIPGSTFLGFRSSYKVLVGDVGLDTIDLGRDQMEYAVQELAKYTPKTDEMILEEDDDPYGKPEMMLGRLVIMLCEGLRFRNVCSTVDKQFDNKEKPVKITNLEATQVRFWKKISWAVLNNDFRYVEKETHIKDRKGAKETIALLKDQKTNPGEDKDDEL